MGFAVIITALGQREFAAAENGVLVETLEVETCVKGDVVFQFEDVSVLEAIRQFRMPDLMMEFLVEVVCCRLGVGRFRGL